MKFFNHQIETEESHIKRVSEQISKILVKEGLVFDVDMIPQIRIRTLPKPKVEEIEKKDV